MNLGDGPLLLIAGSILFVVGVFIMRPERDAPKDWRHWTGTVTATLGAGMGMIGALYALEPR